MHDICYVYMFVNILQIRLMQNLISIRVSAQCCCYCCCLFTLLGVLRFTMWTLNLSQNNYNFVYYIITWKLSNFKSYFPNKDKYRILRLRYTDFAIIALYEVYSIKFHIVDSIIYHVNINIFLGKN